MLVHDQLQIFRVKLAVPKLSEINCYAIRGTLGWSIIDTGISTEENRLRWEKFMLSHQIKGRDIKEIYVTHGHTDHYGLGGWLQQISGAPVYISENDKTLAYTEYEANYDQLFELYIKNDMPPQFIPKARKYLDSWKPYREPFADLCTIEPGNTVQLGDFPFKVLPTPGHSDGHICFYNKEIGVLISGDHILPHITPTIGLYSFSVPNPLNNFLQTLQLNSSLGCQLVLPAHGEPFTNLKHRIDEIIEFHSERLALIKSCVGKGSTVYEVSFKLFGDLDITGVYLGMAEVYAHLMYLVYKGELQLVEKASRNVFSILV